MKIHPQQEKFNDGVNPIKVGVYQDIIKDTSTAMWDKSLFPPRRRTQRKTWYFGGFFNEKIMAGLAVVDAGLISKAFVYFFIPEEQLFIQDEVTIPYLFPESFDPSLDSDWVLKDYSIITRGKETKLSYKGKFSLEMTFQNNKEGLSMVCPSPGRPFNFTYKNACFPSKITINYKGKQYNSEGNYGTIDFSKGYPPRHTFWNWSAIVGKTADNQLFGANLLDGHNGKYENVAWIGEDKLLLPVTQYTYTKGKNIDKDKWYVKSTDGTLEAVFTPLGSKRENVNAVVLKSKFVQCFGKYEGKVKQNGKWVEFVGYGPAEEHEALW